MSHPRQTGHGEELLQNVVYGGGNGNPLQYSCHENPTNSMKRQKDRTPEDEPPRSKTCRFCYWGRVEGNSSRKNKAVEPKWK